MAEGYKKKNMENLTMSQIQYLTELRKLKKKRGSVSMVAELCHVRHASVSRFFKACVEEGYLTEGLQFTEKGEVLLEWHTRMLQDVRDYFERNGVTEGLDKIVGSLIENVDYTILECMVRSDRVLDGSRVTEPEETGFTDVTDMLNTGDSEVPVAAFQWNGGCGQELSMTDCGVASVAVVHNGADGIWMELMLQELPSVSCADGGERNRCLSGIRYVQDGKLHSAKIEGGRVQIPLDACRFQKISPERIRGNLLLTVSAPDENRCMTESMARLVFMM